MPRFWLILPCLVLAAPVYGDDWPQFMGPNRNGVWTETGILEKFPEKGPKKLWSVPINGGYAGPAVVGQKVVVTDHVLGKDAKVPNNPFDTDTNVSGTERVLCFDAKSGKELWKHEYPCDYKVSYGCGPRCTPTIEGNSVYTLGTMGHLICLSLDQGEVIWKKEFTTDYKAKTPTWGFCGHPLILGEQLICLVGGEKALLVSFDKKTGKELWKSLATSKPGMAGYAPPTLVEIHGEKQILLFHPTGLTAVNPSNGHSIWSVPMKPQYEMSIMVPQQTGSKIFAGAIGGQAVLVDVKNSNEVHESWRGDGKTNGIYPVNMTPLIDGDTIYGVDQPGMLRAVELSTGKRLWYAFEPVIDAAMGEDYKGAGSGTCFLVKNGSRYFIFNEKGSLIIAHLTPKGYEEISRTHLIEATGTAFGRKVVWSHPAFANKCIYTRNDKELACYSLTK